MRTVGILTFGLLALVAASCSNRVDAYAVECSQIIDITDELPDAYVELAGAVALPFLEDGMQVGRSNEGFRYSKFGMAIRADIAATVSVATTTGQAHLDYGGFHRTRPNDDARPIAFDACPGRGSEWVIYAGGIWTTEDGCVDLTVNAGDLTEASQIGIRTSC